MSRRRKTRRLGDYLEVMVKGDESRVYDFLQFLAEHCGILDDKIRIGELNDYDHGQDGQLTFGKLGNIEAVCCVTGYYFDRNGRSATRSVEIG